MPSTMTDDEKLLARAYALLWDGDYGPDGVDLATDICTRFKPLTHDSIMAMAESACEPQPETGRDK